MKTTTDKYELPEAVAGSAKELARMVGKSPDSIATMISRGYPGYHKVKVDNDWFPTNDGGLWRYGENGKVEYAD